MELNPQVSRRGFITAVAAVTVGVIAAKSFDQAPAEIPVAQVPILRQNVPLSHTPEYLKRHLPADHFIRTGPDKGRRVAVTVDDFSQSYAPDYLKGLIDIGRQTDSQFTLFPIGTALAWQYRKSRHLWQQATNEGHIIGNHTWDHDTNLANGSRSHIESELGRQRQLLHKVLGKGYDQYLMRPPGGSGGFPNGDITTRNEQQFRHEIEIVRDLGYWMTMWSTDSNDPRGNVVTPDATAKQEDARFLHKIFHGVAGNTYERVRSGSIILVHPNTLSLNGMRQLITGLHQREYQCVTVPELFVP